MKTAVLYNNYTLVEIENVEPNQIMHELLQVDSIFLFINDNLTETNLEDLSDDVKYLVNVDVVDNYRAISYYTRVEEFEFKISEISDPIVPLLHTKTIDYILTNLSDPDVQKLYAYDIDYLAGIFKSGRELSLNDYKQLLNFIEAYIKYSTITVGKHKLYIPICDFKAITDKMILSDNNIWSVIKLAAKYINTSSYK